MQETNRFAEAGGDGLWLELWLWAFDGGVGIFGRKRFKGDSFCRRFDHQEGRNNAAKGVFDLFLLVVVLLEAAHNIP